MTSSLTSSDTFAASASSTVAFTCCDKGYEDFAPLFAVSLLAHNPDAAVEIGVEDTSRFLDFHRNSWNTVTAAFPRRAIVRDVDWRTDQRAIIPHMIRFLETPTTPARYVYLADVDFIILENLVPVHLEIMKANAARYSNIVRPRPGRPQLSGLHFTEYDAHYPLPDISDVPIRTMGDEELLYEIVRRKGLRIYRGKRRPQHGIHISPQRSAVTTLAPSGQPIPGWGIPRFAKQFTTFVGSELMAAIRPNLSPRIHRCLSSAEEVAAHLSRSSHTR